jgi:Homeodomain-like domain
LLRCDVILSRHEEEAGGICSRARDRTGLEGILRDGNVPQKIVKRAKSVLMTADGAGVMTIMRAVGVSKTTVWRWQDYFVEANVTGLLTASWLSPARTAEGSRLVSVAKCSLALKNAGLYVFFLLRFLIDMHVCIVAHIQNETSEIRITL